MGYMGQSLRCNETIAENFIYKLKKSQVECIIYIYGIYTIYGMYMGGKERKIDTYKKLNMYVPYDP